MLKLRKSFIIGFLFVVAASTQVFSAEQFEVTVINLTRGQQFTPLLVATHKGNVRIFTVGAPSSSELRTLAEEGNTAPLMAVLSANADYKQVLTIPGLLDPGKSATTKISADGADFLTVAAMLIPTNDAFLALNGVRMPGGTDTADFSSPLMTPGRNETTSCARQSRDRTSPNAAAPERADRRAEVKDSCISTRGLTALAI